MRTQIVEVSADEPSSEVMQQAADAVRAGKGAEFLRSRATEFFMNYDWVKHPGFWKWVYEDPRVDGGLGGTHGTTIMIMEHGRIGHERPAV